MSSTHKPVTVDVYYDFLCPWAFRGSEWLRETSLVGSAALFAVIGAILVVAYVVTLRRIRLADTLFRAAFMQSTVGMHGDLQGIAGKTIQEIEGMELLAMEST